MGKVGFGRVYGGIAFGGNGLRATSKQTPVMVLDTWSNLITLQISELNTSKILSQQVTFLLWIQVSTKSVRMWLDSGVEMKADMLSYVERRKIIIIYEPIVSGWFRCLWVMTPPPPLGPILHKLTKRPAHVLAGSNIISVTSQSSTIGLCTIEQDSKPYTVPAAALKGQPVYCIQATRAKGLFCTVLLMYQSTSSLAPFFLWNVPTKQKF
jgi:hypothetical protein